MQYDVIIVGSGPAGSTTAKYCKNANILLIDRRKEIGLPVQCGEYLPSVKEIKEILPNVENLEELFSLPENMIAKKFKKIIVVSPNNKEYELKFEGFSIERKLFDKYLVENALKNKAKLLTETRVKKIQGNKVITNKGEFSAKIIIGADGPLSTVAKECNFKREIEFYPAITCQVEEQYEEMKMFFGNIAKGGYSWIIPKKETANVGLGINPKLCNENLKKLLNKFLQKINCNGKILSTSTKFVPIGIPKTTVKEDVALVGDAAGHVMATNGGGIPIAMSCGRILGNVISEHFEKGVSLEKYENEWRKLVGKPLRNATETKKLADLFFANDLFLSLVMKFMGKRMMERAIRCKNMFLG